MNNRDLRFVLFEFLELNRLMKSEKFNQLEISDLDMTLKEAEKIAINILSPANKEGDREGCHLESGSVRVPESFHRCWRPRKVQRDFRFLLSPKSGSERMASWENQTMSKRFLLRKKWASRVQPPSCSISVKMTNVVAFS
jgi:hypothetical protein